MKYTILIAALLIAGCATTDAGQPASREPAYKMTEKELAACRVLLASPYKEIRDQGKAAGC